MLKLYYSPGSCSVAARIALAETGEPHELALVSIPKGEQISPEFLALNPRGRIPVLVEENHVLVELIAILFSIAERRPEAGLLPSGARERADCVSLLAWLSNTVQPGFSRFFRPNRISAEETAHAGIKAMARDFCWQNMMEIDGILNRREWIAGTSFTLADTLALVFYAWGMRIELPVRELGSYTRLVKTMLGRESVQAVLQDEHSILLEIT